MLRPHDNLRLRVVMPPIESDLSVDIIASLAVTLAASKQWRSVLKYWAMPTLQLVSITCTEKGYAINGLVQKDMARGPGVEGGKRGPRSVMAIAAAGLWHRFQHGDAAPLALVSMDNCAHNGAVFENAVRTIVEAWVEGEFVSAEFLAYVNDRTKVTFPCTMIDRITPRPANSTVAKLSSMGILDVGILRTSKGTFIAPFTNTEHVSYLAMEDAFPNGRPALEKTGVIFAPDAAGIDAFERMKVGTCLNPLHTTLAVFGCLLTHTSISLEMADVDINAFVRAQAAEGLPKVVKPANFDPAAFLNTCLDERFPNPNVPDTPQRIATDTSRKVAVRYGGTIAAYGAAASGLTFIPLAVAGWLRYIAGAVPSETGRSAAGKDDAGTRYTLSDDPALFGNKEIMVHVGAMRVGEPSSVATSDVKAILDWSFGMDLYAIGVGQVIEELLKEMMSGNGAVRACVQRCLAK
tara:strand:- start:803 stop:2194 length:1392 start_codon:yes stop_codon:yes gene_type:complete